MRQYSDVSGSDAGGEARMIYAENIFICIVVPLLVSLLFIRDKVRHFVVFLMLGMSACLLSAYISAFLGSVNSAMPEETSVFISPVVEEIMKLIPVLFFLLVFEPDDESLIMGAVAIGIGFATFENCCFILSGSAESLTYMLIRGLAVGVMHIVCTVTVGYGLAFSQREGLIRASVPVGLLAFAATFHGLYNLLVSKPGIPSYIGFVLPITVALVLRKSMRQKMPGGQE